MQSILTNLCTWEFLCTLPKLLSILAVSEHTVKENICFFYRYKLFVVQIMVSANAPGIDISGWYKNMQWCFHRVYFGPFLVHYIYYNQNVTLKLEQRSLCEDQSLELRQPKRLRSWIIKQEVRGLNTDPHFLWLWYIRILLPPMTSLGG